MPTWLGLESREWNEYYQQDQVGKSRKSDTPCIVAANLVAGSAASFVKKNQYFFPRFFLDSPTLSFIVL